LCPRRHFHKVSPHRSPQAAIGAEAHPNPAAAGKEETMAEPVCAQKAPFKIMLEAGKDYWWCACGRSSKQPFCDGSHKGCGIDPMKFSVAETTNYWLCGCKASAKQPFCDGRHKSL
jgi:CDGSH-type Zn-finger protein